MNSKLGLIPLRNFGVVVEDLIYRSAQPLYSYEYKWLKNILGISTIINLRSEKDIDPKFAEAQGIEVISFAVKDHQIPTLEQAEKFIQIVKDHIKEQKPLLFHCEHGHGRTSTFCVLARIAMGWTLQEALDEEELEFHYEFKHPHQINFLKQNFHENQMC